MIYRGVDGKPVAENAWTDDRDEALRLLAQRAIETLKARIVELEPYAEETPATRAADQSEQPSRNRREQTGVRRVLRKSAADRGSNRARTGGRK